LTEERAPVPGIPLSTHASLIGKQTSHGHRQNASTDFSFSGVFPRRTNEFNLLVFKPELFTWMRVIELDLVETPGRLARFGNHLDGKDGSCASTEWAIVCHSNPAPKWQYVFLQEKLTSADV
jgi:hypothetical protein